MEGTCTMHGRNEYNILVQKHEGRRPLGRPWYILEDNIRIQFAAGQWEVFSSPPRSDWLWAYPNTCPLFSGYLWFFSRRWGGRNLKLTTLLHLVQLLRLSWALPPRFLYSFMAWFLDNLPSSFAMTCFKVLSWNLPGGTEESHGFSGCALSGSRF